MHRRGSVQVWIKLQNETAAKIVGESILNMWKAVANIFKFINKFPTGCTADYTVHRYFHIQDIAKCQKSETGYWKET
jgi:hypothetical protein